MDEYIKREAALEILEKSLTFCETLLDIGEYRDGCIAATQDDIGNIRHIPAADVVPKSEVERLTVELDAMRGAANTYKMHYENAMKEIERLKDYNTGVAFKHYFDGRKEVAREIFEEIDRYVIRGISVNGDHLTLFNGKNYAELKKKYIGESDVKRDTV